MAIDKNKTKDLLKGIDSLFDQITLKLSPQTKEWIKNNVMGPALKEIRELVEESRPPIMYLVGRSGHGKSSLINALADKRIAKINEVKPCTPASYPYLITFKEVFSTWQIIDSRGIFESTRPQNVSNGDAIDQVKNDIFKYKPDIIFHVISAPEARNLSNDLKFFEETMNIIKHENNINIPSVIVLNKADTLDDPSEWPPEEHSRKGAIVKKCIDYMVNDVLKVDYSQVDLNTPLKGYIINNHEYYISIIPVQTLWTDNTKKLWNVDVLSEFIGNHLPKCARLDFFQAQRRKNLLKKISSSLIKRFSIIAGGVGSSPVPISDIIVLTPLQLLMISIIAGLSCRSFSKNTALEYLGTAGVNVGTGIGLRKIAQQLSKLIPIVGPVVSGTIAYVGTYAIGKSAEAYFFSGQIKKPKDLEEEAKQIYKKDKSK